MAHRSARRSGSDSVELRNGLRGYAEGGIVFLCAVAKSDRSRILRLLIIE